MRTDAEDAIVYDCNAIKEMEQKEQREEAYRQGYKDAKRRLREIEVERQRRTIYFFKQRLIGVVLIVVSIICAKVLGDATAAVLLVPLGGYVAFTKKMMIVDSYFLEQEEKKGDVENGGSIRERRTADKATDRKRA